MNFFLAVDDVEAKKKYKSFIKSTRKRLELRSDLDDDQWKQPLSEDMLTISLLLKNDNERWRSIALTIRMIGRCYLQLLGYQKLPDYSWFEFGKEENHPPHLIDGSSSFLGFDGDYGSLEKAASAGKKIMEDIPLGQYNLVEAVVNLATSNDSHVRALSLIVIKQMIIESIKFPCISDLLISNYTNEYGILPTIEMMKEELFHQYMVQSYPATPAPSPPPSSPSPTPKPVLWQCSAGLSLLKTTPKRQRTGLLLPPLKQQTTETLKLINSSGFGTEVVQVFGLYIKLKNSGHIYGTIEVSVGDLVYKKCKDDAELIEGGRKSRLLLTGRSSFSSYDSYFFKVKLRDRDRDTDDDLIIDGNLNCDVFRPIAYDKMLKKKFVGSSGSVATLVYAVMSDAANATVKIKLTGGYPTNKVCGELFAGIENFGRYESLLFRKLGGHDYAEARPGDQISLSTSVIAVPLEYHLIVRVRLYHCDTKTEIANGIAKFVAKNRGKSEENISGKEGQILVKVNWAVAP